MLKDQIHPTSDLLKRGLDILGKVSFGLEIVAVDTGTMVMQTPQGMTLMWHIIYVIKSPVIGQNLTQVSAVDSPFVSDEVLTELLQRGCDGLRKQRSDALSALNGRNK